MIESYTNYISWCDYVITHDMNKRTSTIIVDNDNAAIRNLRIKEVVLNGKSIGDANIFESYSIEAAYRERRNSDIRYTSEKGKITNLLFAFNVHDDGIDIAVKTSKRCRLVIEADLYFGNKGYETTYPVSSEPSNGLVRSALGPAASSKDNMLFDRLTDTAIKFDGGKSFRIRYDWERGIYTLTAEISTCKREKPLHISFERNVLSRLYNIDYAPISKNTDFGKTPPVGWMTWYSVKFDACEELVLKNAKWMSENLKRYGANSVWVDWEWYHKDFEGLRDDGVDCLNPDPVKYPHGLKYVSDKIKEMGLIPALWIGCTNEGVMGDYLKKNPEVVFLEHKDWCGSYYLDFTHPKYLNEFLPMALKKAPEWGYNAIKFDTLPIAMMRQEQYHSQLYNPDLTTKQAYRNVIKKTREVLGDKCFMLACSGGFDDSLPLWAADIFDSTRVGEDIFEWKDFMERGVGRTLRFYALHNNVLYCDCDNVVLREEFNDSLEAASRIYFVSMLGLPITFGDQFDALDDERIDFIKSCLPVLDIHPVDICKQKEGEGIMKMNLAIEKEWEAYNIVNFFNTAEEALSETVSLASDLGLDRGEYIFFDYTAKKLAAITDDSFDITLKRHESRVFSVRRKLNRPQIISTSRHITQGAAEISDVKWSDNTLTLTAELLADVPYTVTFYLPEGYEPSAELKKVSENVYEKTVTPKKDGLAQISVKFASH